MDSKEFSRIVDNTFQTCERTLNSKAAEYAEDYDRLHNFKIAASLGGTTLRQAVSGMMIKHTVSIYDMTRSDASFTAEQWDEKIIDHINYLILLRACLAEGEEDEDQLKFDFDSAGVKSDEVSRGLREGLRSDIKHVRDNHNPRTH